LLGALFMLLKLESACSCNQTPVICLRVFNPDNH
jgi:hypothetical protein